MKLPEAIALMLEGKVMVDDGGILHRTIVGWGSCGIQNYDTEARYWKWSGTYKALNGWREATPEELKEIGL